MAGIRKFRFGERREARENATASGDVVLTNEDEQNLDAFAETLKETIQLLREEIEAINSGKLGVVSEFFERKSKLMKWLELKTPLIEPFLPHQTAREKKIHLYLEELKEAAATDGELLSRMSIAARSVVREIEKASDRNGLSGIYGKSGQKLGAASEGNLRIDREF